MIQSSLNNVKVAGIISVYDYLHNILLSILLRIMNLKHKYSGSGKNIWHHSILNECIISCWPHVKIFIKTNGWSQQIPLPICRRITPSWKDGTCLEVEVSVQKKLSWCSFCTWFNLSFNLWKKWQYKLKKFMFPPILGIYFLKLSSNVLLISYWQITVLWYLLYHGSNIVSIVSPHIKIRLLTIISVDALLQ